MSEYLKWYKSHTGHSEMKRQAKEEIERLTEQLAKADEAISKLKSDSFPDGYIAVPSESWHEQCQYEGELAKANERVKELEKRNNNQSKTIEAMEGCIANEITKAFEKAEIPRHAKAGCIGEFNFTIEDGVCCPECWQDKDDSCHMCNGESDENGLSDLTATVPWDLCKSIWLRMNKIYAEQLRKEQE